MGSSILSLRSYLDEEVGIDSSHLTDCEIDKWRPQLCRTIAQELTAPTFIKVHDAYSNNARGEPLFPSDAVAAVVYAVRNPLQVCVSYAHHQNDSLDWAIEQMANEDALLFNRVGFQQQMRQKLSSWHDHVSSWADQSEIPLHLVKYEDLNSRTEQVFSDLLSGLGFSVDQNRIRFAVESSRIEKLQHQEGADGFLEKNPNSFNFFRSGKTDDWKQQLTPVQVSRIKENHRPMMEKLGYL